MKRPANHRNRTTAQVQGRRNILVHREHGRIWVVLRYSYSPVESVPPETLFSGRALAAWRRSHDPDGAGCEVPTTLAVRTEGYDPEAGRDFDPSGKRGASVLAGHEEVLAAIEELQHLFGPDLPVQDNLPDEYWERRERVEAHPLSRRVYA